MKVEINVAPPEAILFCAVRGIEEETIIPLAILFKEVQECLKKRSFKELHKC